jgi:glutamate-1-semialdehyde 2,1-aminomutase
MVRFARGGGEAMAIAVRIARAHTCRDKVAFCGYHGWHDWYLAANLGTTNALGEHLLPGLEPNGVPSVLAGTALPFHYNRLDELKSIVDRHRGELAAIIMEPIRSEQPKPGFLEGVAQLAKESRAVFIIDEISAGFRMNSGGAHLVLGIEPDMSVFSKGIGNGYAIAAVIGTHKVMEAAQSTFISSTNWTERIGPVAALATIKKHRRVNAGKHLMEIGTQVQTGWQRLAAKHDLPIHAGGISPLSHFSFETDNPMVMKSLFVQLMLEKGFLASTSFYAMYVHTTEHVHQYLQAMDEVLAEIAELHSRGETVSVLVGGPATAGFARLA